MNLNHNLLKKKKKKNLKITNLGIDSVEIDRFKNWVKYPSSKLLKIFSDKEIEYCTNNPIKSSERFAARFAAKEAAYKALSPEISFIKFCKLIEIIRDKKKPQLIVAWHKLNINQELEPFISITHTKLVATAIVVFQKK